MRLIASPTLLINTMKRAGSDVRSFQGSCKPRIGIIAATECEPSRYGRMIIFRIKEPLGMCFNLVDRELNHFSTASLTEGSRGKGLTIVTVSQICWTQVQLLF